MKLAGKLLAILLAALLAFGVSAPAMAADGDADEAAITEAIIIPLEDGEGGDEGEGLPTWAVWLITIVSGIATAGIAWVITNLIIWLTPAGIVNVILVVLTLLLSPLLWILYSFIVYIGLPAAAGGGLGYLIFSLLS